MPHLDYSIHETTKGILNAIVEGRIERTHLAQHKIENCEHIARQSPALALNLRHNLEMLDGLVMAPTGRMPASVGKVQTPGHLD